jgi:hypothetical protein
MRARFSPWLTLFVTIILTAVMACAAEITLPQVVFTAATGTMQQAEQPVPVTGATLNPTLAAANCPNGDCAKVCLSRIDSFPQSSGSSERGPKAAGQGSKLLPATVLATYPVADDALGAPAFPDQVPSDLSPLQNDQAVQQQIWDYFSTIIPRDQRTSLGYYIVASDGKGGMLASVEQFSGHTGVWALVVDPADASRPRDLTFTLLHEFGHLLSLNSSQVTPDEAVLSHPDDLQIYKQEAASCQQYFASGGCSLPDSYINQFFQQFWTKIYGEWSTVNAARKKSNYIALLAHFYHRHPTQFITAYAATSPEEDMAETWAYFVLNPKPADDSLAHRKVLFFYGFPELVTLRNQIASNICTYAATK